MTFQCEQCEACFPFFNGRMCPNVGITVVQTGCPQTSGPSRSQIGVPSQPYQGPMPPMMGAGSLFGQPPGYVNPHPIHPPRLPPQVNELESSEPLKTRRFNASLMICLRSSTWGLRLPGQSLLRPRLQQPIRRRSRRAAPSQRRTV